MEGTPSLAKSRRVRKGRHPRQKVNSACYWGRKTDEGRTGLKTGETVQGTKVGDGDPCRGPIKNLYGRKEGSKRLEVRRANTGKKPHPTGQRRDERGGTESLKGEKERRLLMRRG